MVMMVMGGVVLVVDGILVLFLLCKSYREGVFLPAVGDLAILQAFFFNFWQCFGICLFVYLYLYKKIELHVYVYLSDKYGYT
jgi:hypothetical protein